MANDPTCNPDTAEQFTEDQSVLQALVAADPSRYTLADRGECGCCLNSGPAGCDHIVNPDYTNLCLTVLPFAEDVCSAGSYVMTPQFGTPVITWHNDVDVTPTSNNGTDCNDYNEFFLTCSEVVPNYWTLGALYNWQTSGPPAGLPTLIYGSTSPFYLVFQVDMIFFRPGASFTHYATVVISEITADCDCPPDPGTCPGIITDFWWCYPGGCVNQSTAPYDYTAGPFSSEANCLNACNLWWCIETGAFPFRDCVQGVTEAVGGPYATEMDCLADTECLPADYYCTQQQTLVDGIPTGPITWACAEYDDVSVGDIIVDGSTQITIFDGPFTESKCICPPCQGDVIIDPPPDCDDPVDVLLYACLDGTCVEVTPGTEHDYPGLIYPGDPNCGPGCS